MKIIKKNGEVQDFYDFKIRTSIKNSAKDCDYPLNLSDINILTKSVDRKIKRLLKNDSERIISSREIRLIIFETLTEYSFSKVAKAYMGN